MATDCNVVLTLVTKDKNPRYFNVSASMPMLSGSVPLIIAYRVPFVTHEDMYRLYQDHWPSDVPFATHTDEAETFVQALTTLLDKLEDEKKKRQKKAFTTQ